MTLGALGDLPMDAVTGRAVKRRMLALIFPELCNLLRVAGGTGIGNISGECDLQWSMRVFMAGKAVTELEMRLSHVTLVTLRDWVLDCRRMSGMTA